MSFGYIYIKKDVNPDGSVRAYCFGKTTCTQRRDQEYRKENPFIQNVASYPARDMNRAEEELIAAVKVAGILLRPDRFEWIRPGCIRDFLPIWHRVANKYKCKPPKLRKAKKVAS